jgi:subunit length determinant Wzz-like protein
MADETGGLIERAAALLRHGGSPRSKGDVVGDHPRSRDQGGRTYRADNSMPMERSRAWDASNPREPEDHRIDLRETLAKFWARKRLIFTSVLICGALAFAIAQLMAPIYTSEASVMIKPQPTNTPATDASIRAMIEGGPEAMPTEALVLQSRSLASEVIRRLHLDRDPEFNPSLRRNRLLHYSARSRRSSTRHRTGFARSPDCHRTRVRPVRIRRQAAPPANRPLPAPRARA